MAVPPVPQDRARAAFVEFRRTRSAGALTEVFDACGQELLLLAHHLAGRGALAEDLLHTTFLEAIRTADQYDPTRPLMPWLCGILVNVARTQNRGSMRQYAADRLPRREVDDPSDLAGAREFAEALAAAIAELPASQREVLTLRLIHGLTPTEIAHALGHPVGSVKSWIHRGIERLKQILPVGFAASLMCVVNAEPSLAVLRERLLADAGAASESSPPPLRAPENVGRLTPIAARTAAWGAAFLAAAGLLATWIPWGTPASDTRPLVAESQRGGTGLAARDLPYAEVQRAGTGLRRSVGDERGLAALTVLARFTSDGAPAAVALRLEPRFGTDPSLRATSRRTDDAGLARFAELEPGPYTLWSDRGAPLEIELPREEIRRTLELPPGLRLSGEVRDEQGRPLAGAAVWLAREEDWNEGELAAFTDEQGRFVLRDVPAGRAVGVLADGHAPAALAQVEPAGDEAARALVFRLSPQACTVRGRVRDEAGQAVAGACVQIGAAIGPAQGALDLGLHALFAPQRSVTDADGVFVCRTVPAGASLPIFVRAAESELATCSLDLQPGDVRDLELDLPAGGVWTGNLATETGGEFTIRLSARPASAQDHGAPAWAHPFAWATTGAPFELRGLPAGKLVLRAEAAAGVKDLREHELAQGAQVHFSPSLRRGTRVHGNLLASDGTPLSGYRVSAVIAHALGRTVEVGADGAFAIDALEEAPSSLVVRGPEGSYDGPLLQRNGLPPGDDPIELRLPHDARASAFASALLVGPPREVCAVAHRDMSSSAALPDAQGRVRIGPLPPGEYSLLVHGEWGPVIHAGPRSLRAGEELDFGELVQRPPGNLQVQWDAPGDDGAPSVDVGLTTCDGALGLTYFKLGRVGGRSLPIPPGDYWFTLADPRMAALQVPVTVREGEVTELTIPRRPGIPIQLRLRGDGLFQGLAVSARLRGMDQAVSRTVFLGEVADGQAPWKWCLGPGRHTVEVVTGLGARGEAEFELREGEPAAACVVELR